MPQGSRKSAVYIPFVRCDDPEGVVDGTIKKPKPNLQKMKGKIDVSPRKPENLHKSSPYKPVSEELGFGGIRGKLHDPSLIQSSDIYRGAETLNDAIDTLSKGLSLDLLRGALDLQESIIMLGKLQKASEYVSKSKKKNQKKKSEKEREDEEGIEEMHPFKFRDSQEKMGFQRPRLSADGSSRDPYEELRKVIRDGLARQNLSTDTGAKERKLDLTSDLAATSSSRSSKDRSEAFTSTDCSFSSRARHPQKKITGPNVVARLMGLEDMPSKSLRNTSKKQLEGPKFVDPRELISGVDMSRERKPQSASRNVEAKQRTLTDVLETVQSKGLRKSNTVGGTELEPHPCNAARCKERLIDDAHPIVVMKPLNLCCSQSSEARVSYAAAEEYLTAKEVLRELKLKKEFCSRAANCEEESLSSHNKHCVVGGEETEIKRVGQEGVTEECKEVIVVLESLKVKPKAKASTPLSLEPEKKESIDRITSQIQEAALFSRRKMLQKDLEPKAVPKTLDQRHAHSAKVRNSESRLAKTKSQPCKPQNTAQYTIPLSAKQSVADQRNNQIEDEQSAARKVKGANDVREEVECNDEARRISLPCKIDSILSSTCTTAAEQLPAEAPTNAFEIQIDVLHADGVTVPTNRHEKGAKLAVRDVICQRTIKRRSSGGRASLKALLLSSPSFLDHAEKLFDLSTNQLIALQAYDIKESSPRLSLDCANEILARKSLRDSPRLHPLLPASVSMDWLVEEVCDGLEDLKSYCDHPMNSLYSVLERDIGSKGVASGTWAFGWTNEFTVDDIAPVVGDMDELILSNLIEEILNDSLARPSAAAC